MAPSRLDELRRAALQVMEVLEPFEPYLYGSVLTGKIGPASDVDLLAYADAADEVGACLLEAEYEATSRLERSKRRGLTRTFFHYDVPLAGTTVEISVYPTSVAAASTTTVCWHPPPRAPVPTQRTAFFPSSTAASAAKLPRAIRSASDG